MTQEYGERKARAIAVVLSWAWTTFVFGLTSLVDGSFALATGVALVGTLAIVVTVASNYYRRLR